MSGKKRKKKNRRDLQIPRRRGSAAGEAEYPSNYLEKLLYAIEGPIPTASDQIGGMSLKNQGKMGWKSCHQPPKKPPVSPFTPSTEILDPLLPPDFIPPPRITNTYIPTRRVSEGPIVLYFGPVHYSHP